MAHKSGKSGSLQISGASKVFGATNISPTQNANVPTFGTSESAGHKVSVGGTKSFTLTCDVVLDDGKRLEDQMEVGDAVTLKAFEDGSVSETYPARVESISKNIDINDGGEITQSVSFVSNGRWTFSGGGDSSGSQSS